MNLSTYTNGLSNHPILFVGTGLSLRYLENSYSWDKLLERVCVDIFNDKELYLQIKYENTNNRQPDYEAIAKRLEEKIDILLTRERGGKFKEINDTFYKLVEEGKNTSRLKIYISSLLREVSFKKAVEYELEAIRRAEKNIGSIITTNYDKLIESVLYFTPVIGNKIFFTRPYGSLYKIHGCVDSPEDIIITSDDYSKFQTKYELIRAHLVSLFIHNPIIFIGYSLNDINIKSILKTIFSYIDYNSEDAQKIRKNFLIVEHKKGSSNTTINEHDIEIDSSTVIRVNKIKTDDFVSIYNCIEKLQLPISVMDVRRVQNVAHGICIGASSIKVQIHENIDTLDNNDKVLYIGHKSEVIHVIPQDLIYQYFEIINDKKNQLVEILNKQPIKSNEFFPIFGFSKISNKIIEIQKLKDQQIKKLRTYARLQEQSRVPYTTHLTVKNFLDDDSIVHSNKLVEIVRSTLLGNLDLANLKEFIQSNDPLLDDRTNRRRLLCAYDIMEFGTPEEIEKVKSPIDKK